MRYPNEISAVDTFKVVGVLLLAWIFWVALLS